MKRNFFLFLVSASVLACFLAIPKSANAQDYSNIRIVRLSFVEGNVQYQRPGEPWQDANLNLPIQEGFALRTDNGYAEVEFEDSLVIRLGTNSTMEFPVLALLDGNRVTHLTVSQGTAIVNAKLSHHDTFSLTAASLNVSVPHNGRFRVDASPAENWVTVLGGKVAVDAGSGKPTLLGGGHTLHQASDSSGTLEVAKSTAPDAFDKWVSQRENSLDGAKNETSSILSSNNYTTGFADLAGYGLWSDIPGVGIGWMPYGMGANWMPFTAGQWMFMGGTGWNWVSSEPWGWMPYHFGSWVNAPGMGWAWVPTGGSYQPGNATWVQVGNQLGWAPNTFTQTSHKPVKPGAAPTVILASQGANGVITAGARVSAQPAAGLHGVHAPPAAFAAVNSRAVTSTAPFAVNRIQAAPVSQARSVSGPASMRAPGGSAIQARTTMHLTSLPRSMVAPHAMPAPRVVAASSRGFRGGWGGLRGDNGGGVVGMQSASPSAAPAASTHASGMSTASHSSSASSAGRR